VRGLVAKWRQAVRRVCLPIAKRVTGESDARTDAGDVSLDALDGAVGSLADSAAFGRATRGVADKALRTSKSEFARLGIKIRDAEPSFAPKITKWRAENVGLIKTLFGSEKQKLTALLSDGEGRRYESLAKDIEGRLDVTQRHAEFLAIDQTLKLNAAITQGRMEAAGVTSYVWTTAGDERVRESHQKLDGQQFDFDDPPETNEDGDKNNPGEDFRCRCVAYPVIPEVDDQGDGETETGGSGGSGGGAGPPAEAPDETPGGFTEGIHAETIAYAGISQAEGNAILDGLGQDDRDILQAAPIGRLELAKHADIEGEIVNGHYTFQTKQLVVAADRADYTYGYKFVPGKSWGISMGATSAKEAAQRTLVHELGHHIHRSADGGSGGGRATSIIANAFGRLKFEQRTPISQYANSNYYEYFAESFAAYRYHPHELLQHDPTGYKMVKDVLALVRP
jgi:SPP1 gp7 family putative phage head morphogenesis protein